MIQAQGLPWSKVELTSSFSNLSGKIEYVDSGELVFLSGGDLFHVRFDETYSLEVQAFENQLSDVKDFILIDVDWDGDKDIMAVIEGGPIQVYEKIDQKFIYNMNIKIFNWINANTLSVHDFNDDGYGDILLNNILYVAKAPLVFERTHYIYPDNYYPRVAQFFDYDLDGDKDMLMQLVSNLFVMENTGIEGMKQINIQAFLNKTSWARVIKAGNKDVIIIFSGGDKKFYRLYYENNTIGHTEIGSYTHTKQTYTIKTKDLDGDGVEEIISDQYFNQLTILSYDTLADTLNIHTYSVPNFQSYTVSPGEEPQLFIRYSGQVEGISWDKSQNKMVRNFLSPTVFLPTDYQDIDGDGFVDLVKDLSVKRYLGERTFENSIAMNIDSTGGQWKDFDGDGDQDYVLKFGWYRNAGNLLFDPYQTRTPDPVFVDPQIFFTNIVFRGDLDGDGDIDVLTYNRFGEPLELHENAGGTFSLKQVLVTNTTISGFLRSLYFEDFDGDGKKDILIAAASGMAWMKNLGSLVFGEPILLYNDSYSPLMTDIADVNNDGIMDLVLSTGEIITGKALGSVLLYLGSLDGTMKEYRLSQGNGYHRVGFADLNRLGWKDIVFSKEEGLFTVILDDINSPEIHRINFEAGSDKNFQVEDLDGDLDDDIIVSNAGGSLFYIINGVLMANACPPGSVFLRNQEQVDLFVEKYGTCRTIPGDLFIGLAKNSDADIQDISGLLNVHKIQGNLTIHYSTAIQDFAGFINLDTIEGSLILNRFSTKNLQGFDSLRYIGKDLELRHTAINSHNFLLDTRELGNVRFVGGNISLPSGNFTNLGIQSQEEYFGNITLSTFAENHLTNIDFLKNTRKIRGSLNLDRCKVATLEPAKNLEEVGEIIVRSQALHTVGMGSKLDSIKGSLVITATNQAALFSDTSFANLKFVGNNLELFAKTLKGFSHVEKVLGSLSPSANTLETGFLDKIEFVGKNFSMGGVENVYTGFLRNVDSIPGYINFLNNSFPDLSFMSSIKKAGSFDLNLNNSIKSIADLQPDLQLNGRLLIWRCPNLTFCDVPFVCKHIADGKPHNFDRNGPQCNDPADFDCLSNAFSGQVFYDQNQNGDLDDNEFPVSGQKLTTFNKPRVFYSGSDGKYRFYFVPNDSFNIGLLDADAFLITTNPERYTGRFTPEVSQNKDNHFGIFHRYPSHDVVVSVQSGLFVCNRPAALDIQVLNQGSFSEKTRVKIQLPARVPLDSITGVSYDYDEANGIVWLQTDSLQPFQRKKLSLWVTAPAWNPDGDNNHLFTSELQVFNASGQWISVAENEKIIELLCSYDPNDKLVEGPFRGTNLLFGETGYLDYTIRFQNTGNYYAENVLLTDTLSANLDTDSLQFIAASHEPMHMTRNGNILKFYFPGIMLPDSTRDFTGSQGYVRFKIKSRGGMDAGDAVNNTAHIYFDYNPPITTNTVSSFVLLPDHTNDVEDLPMLLWPQPALDKLWIQLNGNHLTPDWRCTIFSQKGDRLIFVPQPTGQYVDVTSLGSGLYWMVLDNEVTGQKTAQRFIKL